jgi:hypothetical protein
MWGKSQREEDLETDQAGVKWDEYILKWGENIEICSNGGHDGGMVQASGSQRDGAKLDGA